MAEATDTAGNIESSPVKTGIIFDTTPATTPSADPAAGDYSSDQSVTLSSDDALSGVDKIYFTTDGTDPSAENGTVYDAEIIVDKDMTIKAIVYDKASNASDILTAAYGIPPIISAETESSVSSSAITITWTTDDPATSRVIYDTVSHPVLGTAPNYGYAGSTVEDPVKVTSHLHAVSGLSAGTVYFYRTISHGSPETVGDERSFSTTQVASTNDSTSTSTSTSNTSSTSTTQPSPSPAVLGVKRSSLAPETSPEEGQVLGESTKDGQSSQAESGQEISGGESPTLIRNFVMALAGLGILGLLIFFLTRRKAASSPYAS